MANDIKIEPSEAAAAQPVATDDVGGRHYQIVKLAVGAEDSASLIDSAHPLPVEVGNFPAQTGLTDTQLRASAVAVSAASLPLPAGAATEATLAALHGVADTIAAAAAAIQAAVVALNTKTTACNTGAVEGVVSVDNLPATQPVSGSVAVSNFPATQPVSGTVAVSGTVPVSGPLTDAQLRAAAIPISDGGGSVTVDGTIGISGTVPVSGPLTDDQLRAEAVPVAVSFPQTQAVSAEALPLPVGAATDATAEAIRDMTETLVTQLQLIATKFGCLNRLGMLEVTNSPSQAITTQLAQTAPTAVNAVCRGPNLANTSDITLLYKMQEPFQFSNMGALHLYNQIEVS